MTSRYGRLDGVLSVLGRATVGSRPGRAVGRGAGRSGRAVGPRGFASPDVLNYCLAVFGVSVANYSDKSSLVSPHRSDHCPTELPPRELYLSEGYRPCQHDTSSTGKHETHHELQTILRVTPACRTLLPYVPKLSMVLQTSGLTFR